MTKIIFFNTFVSMTNVLRNILLLLNFIILIGCGAKESIEPFTKAITTAESQGKDPELNIVSGGFTFDDISINNPVGKIPIPILGTFVQNLANVFADVFVLLNNDWEVDQDAQFIDIPSIDSEYINSIQVRNLEFKIVPNSDENISESTKAGRRARLDFIEKIDIYIANDEMLARGESTLLARYRYNKNQLKDCLYECIKLTIQKDGEGLNPNIVPLLNNASKLYIFPKVEINSIPKAKFRIRGKIDFRLKFKLPF